MTLIITICVLLLLAYIFDISSKKVKIPSVILLLILGWLVREIINIFDINVPNLQPILPLLGNLGLILIVLEGSLELELSRKKTTFIGKSFAIATLSIILFCGIFSAILFCWEGIPFKTSLIATIPLSIISSAIAIPSARNLNTTNREFITYESSLSDIIGVIFFNFMVVNNHITMGSFKDFGMSIVIMLIITILGTICLSYILSKTSNHVKYVPIILMLILIYAVSKNFHLPALIFILLFGLFLANVNKLKYRMKFLKLEFNVIEDEVPKFRSLTAEITFLIRSLFFLLFGFLIDTSELFDMETISWTLLVIALIYAIRLILLKAFRIDLKPLLFLAPRGLITILLFLSIPTSIETDFINNSMITQVIILSALIMMIGLMYHGDDRSIETETNDSANADSETEAKTEYP